MVSRFVLAFQFLTVLRINRGADVTVDGLARSMAVFPVVGAVQGGAAVGVAWLCSFFLPWSVASALALAAVVLTNGGLHMDGFIDTVDGLAGGSTPAERLRIMKDPASGAVGVVFLVLLILLKYVAVDGLDTLGGAGRYAGLFLFPVAGRWAMVPLSTLAGYARREGGLGAAFTGGSPVNLIVATVLAGAFFVLAAGPVSLLMLAAVWVVVLGLSAFFKGRLGGVTGDVYGFTSEVAELLFLVLFLAVYPYSGPAWPWGMISLP